MPAFTPAFLFQQLITDQKIYGIKNGRLIFASDLSFHFFDAFALVLLSLRGTKQSGLFIRMLDARIAAPQLVIDVVNLLCGSQ